MDERIKMKGAYGGKETTRRAGICSSCLFCSPAEYTNRNREQVPHTTNAGKRALTGERPRIVKKRIANPEDEKATFNQAEEDDI